MSSCSESKFKNKKSFFNEHNVMMFFAIVFLIIAFIWLIGLSGTQTGSCNASGFGSIVLSSQDEDGNTNPTYEVIAEFFIALFLIIGVAMLTYILTTKNNAKKLVDQEQYYAAMIINGNKDLSKEDLDKAEKADAERLKEKMKDETNFIPNYMKDGARRMYNGVREGAGQMYNGYSYNEAPIRRSEAGVEMSPMSRSPNAGGKYYADHQPLTSGNN